MLVEFRGYVQNTGGTTLTCTYDGASVTLPGSSRTTDTLFYHRLALPLANGLTFVKVEEVVLPVDAHAALGWGDQLTVRRTNGDRTLAALADVVAFLQTRFGFASRMNLVSRTPPATQSASGVAGEIRADAGYVYVCVADNTWKRAPLAGWV